MLILNTLLLQLLLLLLLLLLHYGYCSKDRMKQFYYDCKDNEFHSVFHKTNMFLPEYICAYEMMYLLFSR